MNARVFIPALVCAIAASAHAANFTTTTQQGAGDTNNWNSLIWNPGPVSPTAGNTYEALPGARVRSPNGTTGSGGNGATGQTFTFPGDSLTFTGVGFSTTGASGEFRFKQNFDNPVFNFPGVSGNPGLILNGGILNNGDERLMTISGLVGTASGTISSINPGGQNPNDISANRAFLFTANLTGSGALTLDYARDFGSAAPAVQINSTNTNFTGNWTVNSGWLKGAGLNSLGFGNILMASQVVPALGTQAGSTLDLDYNLTNPTGSLTLQDTLSKLILDQNLTFGAVTINGTPLSVGTHTFAELNAAFDANIVDGGTGNIIVVPEPSAFAMVLLGAFGLMRSRRRRE